MYKGKNQAVELLRLIQKVREEHGYSHIDMIHAFAIGISAHNLNELGVPVYGLEPEEGEPTKKPTPQMDALKLDTLLESAQSILKPTKEET